MSSRMGRSLGRLAVTVSTLAIGLPTVVWAQSATPPADTDKDPKPVIVVTGTVMKERKPETTYTIDTISQAEIQRLAPISTADLLNNIPGFFAEGSTAGERSNNVTVRGLPSSGFRYAQQLVDGMPVFQDSDVPFANSDVFFTNDLMTKQVEAIKGGPGGILYSNGLGGVVNYITTTGGDHFEGGYKLEVANYDYVRNDAYIAGPINDVLHFAIGGFYRTSNGLRPTGFTADKGGQIRGNLTYKSADEQTTFGVYATIMDDRTALYNNLPIQVPPVGNAGTAANPAYINPNTVQPVGINFQNGTLLSPSTRFVQMISPQGTPYTADMADGEHPNFTTLAMKFHKELDSGWKFDVDANYVKGTNGFNELVADGADGNNQQTFLNSRWVNDVLQPAFNAQWQNASGTPNNASFENRQVLAEYFNTMSPAAFQNQYLNPIANAGFSNFNQLRQQYGQNQSVGGAVGVGAFYVTNGQAVNPNTPLSFEYPWITRSALESATENFKVQKDFKLWGDHHLTFGAYHATDSDSYVFQQALTVETLEANPQAVNLYTVNAAGQAEQPLSLNGSYIPSFSGNQATGGAENWAGYVEDHWETLNHRLRIDAGFRWETEKLNIDYQNLVCCTSFVPGGAQTGQFAYLNSVTPGAPQYLDQRYYGNGWSIGANYEIQHNLNVYALMSKSFRLPSFNDAVSFAQSAPLADPVEHITQIEGGARWHSRWIDLSLVGFYNKFTPRTLINIYTNIDAAGCGGTINSNACPLVYQPYSYGTRNLGTEDELTLRAPFIRGFDIKFDLTLQNPKVEGSSETEVNTGPGGVQSLITVSQDGRREARQAAATLFIRPRWDMKPLTGLPVKIYADYEHRSSRYSASTDLNVTLYPSYYVLNAGILWDITDRLSLQLHVANLTNQLSFTEGTAINPNIVAPNQVNNFAVARPLFGRTDRATLNYRF